MLQKILIANRGEIACRIIKTAKKLQIKTVAIYSSADKNSLHVSLADEAYYVGEAPSLKSYLNIEKIIEIAQKAKVDAVHPGYGFLSENPEFAQSLALANIIFIGPGIDALNAMASKKLAKNILDNTDVPLTPGFHGDSSDAKTLLKEAKKIGFPVLLKAASGGGGKGMRAVYEEKEFKDALDGAKREAKSSFGDDTIIIEKLIKNPRHVEIQVFGDSHNNYVHLFERDCSIQRRHQKIIEEAPAFDIPQKTRNKMHQAAIAVARKINYLGAGTVEFLLAPNGEFYFMEMNTRLQVEHGVTEMITGVDLVEWQILVAQGAPIPLKQEDIKKQGHAIECRIYAEDADNNFLPSIGTITLLKEPKADGVRIDTGVIAGSAISQYYDPMIAKLMAHANTRIEAITKIIRALDNYYINGVKTNIAFLHEILLNNNFQNEKITTHFLEDEKIKPAPLSKKTALIYAGAFAYISALANVNGEIFKSTFGFQSFLSGSWNEKYIINDEEIAIKITPIDRSNFKIESAANNFLATNPHVDALSTSHYVKVTRHGEYLHIFYDNKNEKVLFQQLGRDLYFFINGQKIDIKKFDWQKLHETNKNADLTAPMPATVVAILKTIGDNISSGDNLMVLEAMKMEHTICAPKDGKLKDIYCEIGSQVAEGEKLLDIE